MGVQGVLKGYSSAPSLCCVQIPDSHDEREYTASLGYRCNSQPIQVGWSFTVHSRCALSASRADESQPQPSGLVK